MRYLTVIMIVVSLVTVAGCGAVDDAKKEAGEAIRNQFASQCRDEANKIKDPDTRASTLEACDAVKSGDSQELRSKLSKQCLDKAADIEDADSRKQAEQQCRDIRR